jgi:hypothetical protein
VCVDVILQTIFTGFTGKRTFASEDDSLSGKCAVFVVGIGLDAGDAFGARGSAGGVAAILIYVSEIDVAIGCEIGIEGESEQAAITGVVHVSGDVDEGRGENRAILDDADAPGLFPDKNSTVGGEDKTRRRGEPGDHLFVGESGIGECDLSMEGAEGKEHQCGDEEGETVGHKTSSFNFEGPR